MLHKPVSRAEMAIVDNGGTAVHVNVDHRTTVALEEVGGAAVGALRSKIKD